ncbi:MAG: thioredoxin family protein [Amphibacillus sp.]|uniref:Putative thioredoxin n=1 Tax=Amphibacillus xylanus (strain ATCC 51415 / DSM 6626 / JCM 7361 / LMG 17667 / NBRC 15112 / Ep01) TaxID=698758 RepID=K0IX53_AMPXN|nr:thioredoxin family protein [Amphibacillus xylanus]NMA91128.1 thioredoxin family protein [Amphibacillus sp.]BAM47025.1 putative thioredoxin [Amphibacillus xylanus NBRC 15112]
MKSLQTEAQFYELLETGKTVFLFTAEWCSDCRVIEPFLPELEETFSDITFISVDRDQFIDLCIKYDIFGIPSFLAFDQGEEVARFVSKDRKTREEIEAFLSKISAA